MSASADASTWDAAVAGYLTALTAEREFDAIHVDPRVADGTIGQISDDLWNESSRLADVRSDAEDALMVIASPDPAGFAFKYLVARGFGRETSCWDDMLQAEALRFAPGFPREGHQ